MTTYYQKQFTEKTILIISPQAWGKMKVSKHHYALGLAQLGNRVYFLQHHMEGKKGAIVFEACQEHPNITIVKYTHNVPYPLKFHLRRFFHYSMRKQAKKIARKIAQKIDIVWDFDCNFMFGRLKDFGAALNIFHPVDSGSEYPRYKLPDIVFSVSPVLLKKYALGDVPFHFINHGLTGAFEQLAVEELENTEETDYDKKQILDIGYFGNLKHRAIDRQAFRLIIEQNPDHHFHFWGPYELKQSEQNPDLKDFIQFLSDRENCFLYGTVSQDEIAKRSRNIDVFLTCYQKMATYHADNSHKILEYLSTGKVVVSNFLSVYANEAVLQMPDDFSNEKLPEIFKETIQEIKHHNAYEQRKERLNFALENTYIKQIDRIQNSIHLSPTEQS